MKALECTHICIHNVAPSALALVCQVGSLMHSKTQRLLDAKYELMR